MKLEKALTFDDLLIVPSYSDIDSIDGEIFTNTTICGVNLRIPAISAAMTTVTDHHMQLHMRQHGSLGILHRYTPPDWSENDVFEHFSKGIVRGTIAVSPSMDKGLLREVVSEVSDPILAIDVAHGHRQAVLDFASFLKSLAPDVCVMSGNLVTVDAAKDYASILDPERDALKVGIGGGGACSTRITAGVGYPQASAIYDIRQALPEYTIISDGGIKNSGDLVKALALGADAVVIGSLFAGTDEAPGKKWADKKGNTWKEYAGMASHDVLVKAGKTVRVEGVSGKVPYHGSLENVLFGPSGLITGLKLGMSYIGARNIFELQEKATFVQITSAGYAEGLPRIQP